MASKNTLGKKAYIKELNKIGVISKTNDAGEPLEVIIDGEIIDVINLTVKLIGLLKRFWFLIKGLF